jgi:phosphoglycerate dehydrogenase-like enzyme
MVSDWTVLATASTIEGVGQASAEMLIEAGCEIRLPETFQAHPTAALQPLLTGVQGIYAGLDDFSADVLASDEATKLQIISRWGVGYDSIDVAAATELGIVITYTPGLLDEAVADYTFALLLGVARRIHTGHLSMHHGGWSQQWGHDVHGKTLGIVGCGRIGTAVARRAAGFNMRLLAHDPFPNEAAQELGVEFVSLETLLQKSDYVSLHAAVTPETEDLISAPQLQLMKPDSYLINAGRGALVNETDLTACLKAHGIAGAAVDTYHVEPLPVNHPLHSAANLLMSPHQASFATETGRRVSHACAQAIIDLKHGQRPKHVLNPKVFESPKLRATIA